MLDIASRAANGVTIPNRKITREEIMNMFKSQLTRLKERLNVGLAFLTRLSSSLHFFYRAKLSKEK